MVGVRVGLGRVGDGELVAVKAGNITVLVGMYVSTISGDDIGDATISVQVVNMTDAIKINIDSFFAERATSTSFRYPTISSSR